jgi:putative transposase
MVACPFLMFYTQIIAHSANKSKHMFVFGENQNCEMLSAETDSDHMHLLVSMPPDLAPVKLINSLKTHLSKEVRSRYREHIQKYLWGDSPFWSASYFCATTGSVSMETVKQYIEGQRTDEHKRKYIRTSHSKKKT